MPITDDPKPTNTPSPKHPTIASTAYTVHVRAPGPKAAARPAKVPGLLKALLRRLLTECSHLCGMTSEDPDEAARAAKIASDAARKEAAEGGMTVAAGSSGALVERGEDVMTQVTNGLVCLLRVRTAMCDHAASLGYVSKLVDMLSRSTSNKSRYGIQTCCTRVLEAMAGQPSCVRAMANTNIVSVLFRSMSPLQRVRVCCVLCLLEWWGAHRGAWLLVCAGCGFHPANPQDDAGNGQQRDTPAGRGVTAL